MVVGLAAALVVAASATVAVRQVGSTQACPAIADHPDWSVARRWDEALLDAIRRALPAPTLHARNLFHVSAAMWDAWAVYDPHAAGYFVAEKHSVRDSDLAGARNEAISYAAYRVLTSRYLKAMGADSVQGFYLSRPVTGDGITAALNRQSFKRDVPAPRLKVM